MLALLLDLDLGARIEQISLFFKTSKRFERRLREVAILVTARGWTCHYEWYAHAQAAVEHGVSPAVVEAIRTDTAPHFERDDESVVYARGEGAQRSALDPGRLYERGRAAFGEAGMVELITIVGYYTYLAMLINGFELEPPAVSPNPLPTLAR